jgi:cytochrome c biogenesis protein CcmG/thiol:disulfide interchange protein DsbE
MSKLKLLLPLAAFALLALLLARGLQLNPRELPSPLIGKPLPAFELAALPEGRLSSARLGQGRISVLNVWASWCGPCRVEHPLLIELARRHPQVQLIGLAHKDPAAKALAFLEELGNPFAAVGLDEQGRVGIDLGVYGVPETYVVGGDGRVLFKHVGPLTEEVLKERLEPLLR